MGRRGPNYKHLFSPITLGCPRPRVSLFFFCSSFICSDDFCFIGDLVQPHWLEELEQCDNSSPLHVPYLCLSTRTKASLVLWDVKEMGLCYLPKSTGLGLFCFFSHCFTWTYAQVQHPDSLSDATKAQWCCRNLSTMKRERGGGVYYRNYTVFVSRNVLFHFLGGGQSCGIVLRQCSVSMQAKLQSRSSSLPLGTSPGKHCRPLNMQWAQTPRTHTCEP